MTTLSSDGPTVRLHPAVINAVLTVTQLFFAFLVPLNPSKLSMTQLAVLNQASTSLSYTLSSGYEESEGMGIEVRYVATSTAPCNPTHFRGPATYRFLILAANPTAHPFPMSRSPSNLDNSSSSLAPTEVESQPS